MKKDIKTYHEIIDKIAQYLHPDDKVLEIATGTGIISFGLSKHVNQIYAVDFSPHMIQQAKTKAHKAKIKNILFENQDAYALSLPSFNYDAVIIANTLHIMPYPEKALQEISRILKPNGILFAPTFMHAGGLKAALLSLLMSLTGFRAYHKWTQQGYETFLQQNNFTVIECTVLQASFPLSYVVLHKTKKD
jgi:ubiquinone/menaquinone biosynthesis C-methylase UbiE